MSKSHSVKRDSNHIPRPPNSFILFRSDFKDSRRIPSSAESREQVISRVAGSIWRSLPPETRAMYDEKAKKIMEMHKLTYPDYVYKPQRRSNKQTRKKRRTEQEEVEHCEMLTAKFVPDMVGPMPHRPARKGKTKSSRAARTVQEPTPAAIAGPSQLAHSSVPDRSVFTDPLCRPAGEPSSSSLDPATSGFHSVYAYDFQSSLQPPSLAQPPNASYLSTQDTQQSFATLLEADDILLGDFAVQSAGRDQASQAHEPLEVSKYIRQQFDLVGRYGACLEMDILESSNAQRFYASDSLMSMPSSCGIAALHPVESIQQSFSAPCQNGAEQDLPPLAQPGDEPRDAPHDSARPELFPLTLTGNIFEPLELGIPTFDSPSQAQAHACDPLDFRIDQADFDAFCAEFGIDGASVAPRVTNTDCDGGEILEYVLDMEAYFRET